MARSATQDWNAISKVVTDIADVGDLAAVRLELQRSIITRLVGADDASVDEIDYHNGTSSWISINPTPGYEQRREIMNRYFREHPCMSLFEKATRPLVLRRSDALPQRIFERRPLFEEIYRPMGVRYQLTLGLTQGVQCYSVTLHRADRDFSDRDISVLQLAAPLLAPVFKGAVEREQFRLALTATSSNRGLIYLQPNNSILWANDRAREILEDYFASKAIHFLPPLISKWLLNPAQPLEKVNSESRKVKIQLFKDGAERLLLCDQAPIEPTPQNLQSLGLTPRQSEVLFWISRGKSNSEIGTILGTSVHTVNRHAEAIYSRLNVESRAAAAVCARETLDA